MRGLRVALVDKGDFAGATSSRSSKLIHGGLRYLPQGQLRLVFHALRERERLRRLTAPHLVRPIRFLYPFYRGRGASGLAVAAGLTVYDLLARTPRNERHRRLDAPGVREVEPEMRSEGLTGGALYFDAWADDARLTLENALDAAAQGAAVANYVAVEGFARVGARIAAAAVCDSRGPGDQFELRARLFVNAAGPWVDEVRRMEDPGCDPVVRLTKGVHLVIARRHLPLHNALVLADGSGRIVFAMPHGEFVLVGTTDTDFNGDPVTTAADANDVAYLTGVLAASIRDVAIGPADVAYSFAGLRALVVGDDAARPSTVSREEVIVVSASGLVTIAGGKLTTHRQIAEKVVNRLMLLLGRPSGKCPTRATPLPGARPCNGASTAAGELSPAHSQMLVERYGTRAALVAEVAWERPELAAAVAPDAPAIAAEVVHAVRNEMAQTVADFLQRRTSMVWRAPGAAFAAAPAVARILAAELGWDRDRESAELDAFRGSVTLPDAQPSPDLRN